MTSKPFLKLYIIFLPKANLIHFHDKTIHLQPKCQVKKRLHFSSLWADADYKWIRLRKEISQRLNSQINNSIKHFFFYLDLVRPKLPLIIAFVNGFILRLRGRTWRSSFFFEQNKTKQKQTRQIFKNCHRRPPSQGKSRPEWRRLRLISRHFSIPLRTIGRHLNDSQRLQIDIGWGLTSLNWHPPDVTNTHNTWRPPASSGMNRNKE